MKKSLIVTMLMATSLFSVNAFASNHENGDMHKEHRKEMREQHKNLSKEEVLDKLGKHKEKLKERLAKVEETEKCVNMAQNKDEMKKCHQGMKHHKGWKQHKDQVNSSKVITNQGTPK